MASGSADPEALAAAALAGRRFREAIEFYKGLLKKERRTEWLDGLAESYAGRANDLASKGMLPEALAVWRNRASLCGKPLFEGPYIDWLLRSGDHATALRALGEGGAEPGSAASEREMRLAAVALVAPDSTLAMLPADSLLLRHRGAALAAVEACGRGDLGTLDEHLRAIPFRSPYRDLRFLLKSLLLVDRNPAQAAELVGRVTFGGPFERLAAVVRAALLPGNRWLVALLDLDAESRSLLLDLKGCPETRRALIHEIAQIVGRGTPPTPTGILDLLLSKARTLPAVAFLCRRLLPHAVVRLRDYEAACGRLSQAEVECTLALAEVIAGHHSQARRHWLQAVDAFTHDGQSLQAALILRHLSARRLGPTAVETFDVQRAAWLQKSLELDPDDRATHVRLIRMLRQKKDLKEARAAVDAAMSRFVDDPVVLLEAVETALAGNAFKKAVTLATRLLELDPINSQVRALIGQAHLAHARKQFRAQRPDAVNREIDLAEKWLLTPGERSRAKLLRGLSMNTPQATLLLREAFSELGGELPATLQLLLENARLGGQPATALRRGEIGVSRTPSPREVVAAMHVIGTVRKADERFLAGALETLHAPLKRAAQGEFAQADLVAVCETWLRCGQRALQRAYAEAGLRRWPEWPALVYLRARAVHGREAYFSLSEAEAHVLNRAAERAEKEGDQRTVLRIRDLLVPPEYGAGSDDDEEDDFDEGEDEDLAAPTFDVRGLLEMMAGIGNPLAIINLAREIVPDADFRRLQHTAGNNRRKLAQLLMDYLVDRMDGVAGKTPEGRPADIDDRQRRLFDD